MAWWGKIIGAAGGAMLGGPILAPVGAVLGDLIDSSLDSEAEAESVTGSGPTRDKAVRGCAALMKAIAEAGGILTTSERSQVIACCRQLHEGLGGSSTTFDSRHSWYFDGVKNDHVGDLAVYLSDDRIRQLILTYCWRVVLADLSKGDAKERFVTSFAQQCGVSAEELAFSRLLHFRIASSRADNSDELRILGLEAGASDREIRSRYRTLSAKYHPDAHISAEPVLVELAADKFRQIQQAYQALLGADRSGQRLFGLVMPANELKAVELPATLACICCGSRQQMSETVELWQARCPECLALLALEEQVIAAVQSA